MLLKSMFDKCEIAKNNSKTINFEPFKAKIEGYLNLIKSKISAEEYEQVLAGEYQILNVYKKAIPKGSLLSSCSKPTSEQEFS